MSERVRSADGRWEWDGQVWRPVPPSANSARVVASLVLGSLSRILWLVPIMGLPAAVTGLVLGILELVDFRRGLALGGIVTSSVGPASVRGQRGAPRPPVRE